MNLIANLYTTLGYLGAIAMGSAAAVALGYAVWLVIKSTIAAPSARRLIWGLIMIVIVIIVFTYVMPPQLTTTYMVYRDLAVRTVMEDIKVVGSSLAATFGIGSTTNNFRPLDSIGAPAPAAPAVPQSLPTLAPSEPQSFAPAPTTASNQGESQTLMGGGPSEVASCISDDCPGRACPVGCRSGYSWVDTDGRQYEYRCNASRPLQSDAWVAVEVGSYEWNMAPQCPSLR